MTEEEAWLRMFCATFPVVDRYDKETGVCTWATAGSRAAAAADAGLVEFRKRFGQTHPYREGGSR